MRIASVAFIVGLLGAASAQHTPVFERVQWPVGGFSLTRDLHLGDVDADGRLDLIDIGDDGLDVARGLGDFEFGPTVYTAVGNNPKYLSVGHVNGDAFLDAAVQAVPGAWHVVILIGDGSGAFTPAGSVPVGNFTRDTLLAEVTGDGFDDLLILTQEIGVGGVLLVCASDGSGGLATPVAVAVNGGSLRLLVGDVVEDGLADVVVAQAGACSAGGVTYSTLQGDGAGHFSLASSACLGGGAKGAALGDIDGDGHLDLIGTGPAGTTAFDVHAFLGAGDGSFTTDVLVGSGTTEPLAADVTGDGLADVVGQASEAGSYTWPALGGGAFGPRRDSALMPAEVFADLDGDGFADAAGANPTRGTVVAPNRGDGTWDAVLASNVPGVVAFTDTALGDFDGDGRQDVAHANAGGAGGVWTMRGRGDGTFGDESHASAGASSVRAVSVGDATNDGHDDVLAVSSNGQAHLLAGRGDGTFAPALLFAAPITLANDGLIADLDGDGGADIIECGAPNVLVVFRGAAMGGWHAPVSYPVVGPPVKLVLADLDQDGLLDVLASGNAFFNLGHGALAPAQQVLPDMLLATVESADFDEDGVPDVAGVRSELDVDPAFVSLFGLGGGSFGPPVFEPLWTSQAELAAADMNRDGHVDLLMHSQGRELALRSGDGAGNFVLDRFLSPVGLGGFGVSFDVGDVNGDEWPDVVLTEIGGVATLVNQLGVWHDLGFAFNQATGKSAQLSGGGPLQAGSPVVLHLGRARPGSDVALVIGVAQAMLPFKGGVMVPSFDLLLPALVADGHGDVVLEATLPVALPSGTELYFQAFVEDTGAPAGIAPSNALEARAP